MSSKRCKIHYRKLSRKDGLFPKGKTLSTALAEALSHRTSEGRVIDKARLRITDSSKSAGQQWLINDIIVKDGYVFGDMCLFANGQMQALLKIAEDTGQLSAPENPSLAEVMAALEIAEARAPTGHEYLNGISYWLAIGDHFYQIQHTSLQAKSVEEYFTWLMRDRTPVLNASQQVILEVKFDRGQIGEDLGEIKSVEIGGIVPETLRPPAEMPQKLVEREVETRSTIAEQVGARLQKAKNIIAELLGDVEAERLIASVPDEASLEVTVNIGYRAKKRKFNKEFMSNLANGLRNMPDGEVKIRGKDGEIRGDDARLSSDMSVKKVRPESSLLDLADVEAQLLEVHRRFMHDGKISMD